MSNHKRVLLSLMVLAVVVSLPLAFVAFGRPGAPEIPAGGVLQVGSPAPTGSTAADPAGSLPSAAPLTPVPGAVPALTFTPTPVPAPLAPGATGGQPRTVQPPVTRSELPAYDDDDDDDDDDERDDDDD